MENKRFLNVNDVAVYMDVSVPKAYKIIRLQNMLLSHCDERTGRPFSKNYLRNLNAQLAVLFRYAAKYYGHHDNPMDRIMGIAMGTKARTSPITTPICSPALRRISPIS